MGTTVDRGAFGALVTRNNSTGGSGIRTVQRFGEVVSDGNWWDKLLDLGKNFIVNVGGMISSMLQFSATQIVEWIKEAAEFVWEFNWNISDQEIDAQIQQLYEAFQIRVMGVLGSTIGRLIPIGIGGAMAFYVNPTMAKLLVTQVSDDFLIDLINDMGGLLRLVGKSVVIAGVLQTYKTARNLIKAAYKDPIIRGIATRAGISEEAINSWGDKKKGSWSFAEAVEEKIENIPGEKTRQMAEEFLENFSDGFWDYSLIVAQTWDAIKLQQEATPETYVYQPDRSSPEQYYVHGDSEAIANQVMTINTVSTALENRDVGSMTVTDDDRPVTTNNGIAIKFFFLNTLELPYGNANRDSFAKAELIVPNVRKSIITWDKLVELFRPHAFTDGDWKGVMDLENGRQLVSRGNSENECKQLLTKFLQLTESELRGTPIYSHRDGPQTNRWRRRKQQPMHLSHFYVTNYTRATKYEDAGTPNRARHITQRINVGSGSKPLTFDYYLAQAVDSSV